jgi:hypothetical protein
MTEKGTSASAPGTAWLWLAALAWALAVAVACVRGWLTPNTHNCYHFYEPAGRCWLAGEDLYQRTADTCRYSPLFNAAFVPLSLTPTQVGACLWRLVNAAALLGGLAWWLRVFTPQWTRARQGLFLLLILPFAIGNINNGQANPLLLGAMLAGVAAAGRRRWAWAGAFLAAACLLKVYPLALAALLVVVYPRRFAPPFLAALAAGLALPFLLQHPAYVARQYVNWAGNFVADDRTGWDLTAGYRDLWMLIRLARLPLSLTAYRVIQALAGVGVAAVCVAARRLAGWGRHDVLQAAFGLAACWMTVCGPATEAATYVLLFPTAVWAVLEGWRRPWALWVRALLLGSAAAFVWAAAVGLTPRGAELTAYGQHPAGGLLLLAALLGEQAPRLAGRRPDADGPARAPARAA